MACEESYILTAALKLRQFAQSLVVVQLHYTQRLVVSQHDCYASEVSRRFKAIFYGCLLLGCTSITASWMDEEMA